MPIRSMAAGSGGFVFTDRTMQTGQWTRRDDAYGFAAPQYKSPEECSGLLRNSAKIAPDGMNQYADHPPVHSTASAPTGQNQYAVRPVEQHTETNQYADLSVCSRRRSSTRISPGEIADANEPSTSSPSSRQWQDVQHCGGRNFLRHSLNPPSPPSEPRQS